jgi:hypothetical protein
MSRPPRRLPRLSAILLSVSLAACASATAPPGDDGDDGGNFAREVRGGQLHGSPVAIPIASLTGASMDLTALTAVLQDPQLTTVAPALTADDLTAVRTITTPTAGPNPLVHISARQQLDGIPIRDTYLNLTLRETRRGTELASSAYHLYGELRVDTTAHVGRDTAIATARGALRATTATVRSAELEIWPLDGGLRLVWVVSLDGVTDLGLVRANGARSGEVTAFDDRVFDADGTVRGQVAIGGAPGSAGVPQLLPLRDLTVSAGAITGNTSATGAFDMPGATGTVTAQARGLAANVFEQVGTNLSVSAPAGAGLALDFTATDEVSLAQTTAYHFVTSTRQFLIANGFPIADFGAPLTTNTSVSGTCNAYFSPGARTINFFRSGGGCFNSAEATIIAHEYGHFVDHMYGGITEGGLSEGWGDTLSCLEFGVPIVGGDIFPGDIIRTCDNSYQYPASGSDEVHALGQAWAGFVWHAREGLITALGQAQGEALIQALVLPSLPANSADIPASVREVFLRDDDDGDLTNHTPHWDILFAAAQLHSLDFVMGGDLIAPSAVTDLAAVSVGITSAVLSWTAPGDDGATGTAASYDLRTSPNPITPANFSAATPVAAPDPIAAGGTQEATIAIAPGATIHVALRAVDEAGNQGAISNVISVTPGPSTIVFTEGAEAGLGTWTASGQWHITTTRAATGTHSFWYGSEASGNYDNPVGVANSGTLTSPVIDLAGVDQPALVVAQYLHVEDLMQYDLPTITVRDAVDPTVFLSLGKTTGYTGGVFQPAVIDLTTLTGRQVQIDFTFNTVDGLFNSTPGWFLDDIQIIGASAPAEPELVINEVLADPPPGYDSGGDGVASVTADEFVELVNVGNAPLDLSGYKLYDSIRSRLRFPNGTVIQPGAVLVVLGGGASTLPVPTIVSNGLFLNNTGDVVRVLAPDGALVAEFTLGSNAGQNSSLVHSIDGDPLSPIVKHNTIALTPASPGRHSDGTGWGEPPPVPGLVINEILSDPPAGYDASGDGIASTTKDEFLELKNNGTAALDLGGATIADAVQVRYTIPAGTTLAPGGVLVVFAGPVGLSVPGVQFLSAPTLALNNAGDTVTIVKAGATLASASYGPLGNTNQSLVRSTEGSGTAPFVGHLTVSTLVASPGLRANGSPL